MLVDVKGTGRQVNVTYKRYWGSLPGAVPHAASSPLWNL